MEFLKQPKLTMPSEERRLLWLSHFGHWETSFEVYEHSSHPPQVAQIKTWR